MKKEKCPCGSKKYLSECCDRYISDNQFAPSSEALMRSRYTAYTQANIPYIQETMRYPANQGFNADEARQWAKQSDWLGLKVVKSRQESSTKAYVEFVARYRFNGQESKIHECSEFHRIDNRWYYVDGKIIS